MGNIKDLASMLPGVGKALRDVDIDNSAFKGVEAIILSMTPYERNNPQVINGSRRRRIAEGSGTTIVEVNRLLKQFEDTRKVMKMMAGGGIKNKAAGAMRAMITSKNMQALVIRNHKEEIIAFGIIYVNREEGYAVVNDFEVNKKYKDEKGSKRKEEQRRAIYNKAMEGVVAFVEEYNKEYPEIPIMKVTCGISPNWDTINDFIRKNPKSSILKAPDFSEFHYVGASDRWQGDWHKEQYVIYNAENGGRNV